MNGYNGFSPAQRARSQRWLNREIASGRRQWPVNCDACGQGESPIDAHPEDYSERQAGQLFAPYRQSYLINVEPTTLIECLGNSLYHRPMLAHNEARLVPCSIIDLSRIRAPGGDLGHAHKLVNLRAVLSRSLSFIPRIPHRGHGENLS